MMQDDQKKKNGRRIALYPGAFRPPHEAHLTAVLDLASRPEVDEVVVIVSSRCRILPGTTKALDAEVARRIWNIYLQNIPEICEKVRIEVATHTAVGHAMGYFDRVEPGDALLFCIGASDLAQGDDRFTTLPELSRRCEVSAELVAAPTGNTTVRSTELRRNLICGPAGRAAFMEALPIRLNEKQRAEIWTLCCEAMRELSDIIGEKVRAVIEQNNLGEIDTLAPVHEGKLDPVFRVRFRDGRCNFVKYAGDTVTAGRLGERLSPKPRRRLSAERRTLNRLRDHNLDAEVALPEVLLFDKKTLTLVLSEVCPGGRPLLGDLECGHFDPTVASEATTFLAACHTLDSPIKPVWGEHETDLGHWEAMLAMRTTDIVLDALPREVKAHLEKLRLESDQAAQKTGGQQLLILDCVPKNILIGEDNIGFIDLELSSSIGDPAYDFGLFLGHYILWAVLTDSGREGAVALNSALKAYQNWAGNLWPEICSRVLGFAGATLLYQLSEDRANHFQDFKSCLLATGCALLASKTTQREEINLVLSQAIGGHFA